MPNDLLSTPLIIADELNPAQKRLVQRYTQDGRLSRIAPGFYTALPESDWPTLLEQQRVKFLSARFSGAVVGFSSAFGGFGKEPTIYLTAGQNRRYQFPGMEVVLSRGPGALPGDVPLNSSQLFFPSAARVILENLGSQRGGEGKKVGQEKVEERLTLMLHTSGPQSLNQLRDSARALVEPLSAQKEFDQLTGIIGTLLLTRSHKLKSPAAKAVVSGNPYDQHRIDRFAAMVEFMLLTRDQFEIQVIDPAQSLRAQSNFAFLESYFSNFIEGTQFPVDEALDIVQRQAPTENRPKDSHDILGVYEQALNPLMRAVPLPKTDQFALTLAARHQAMLARRPEAMPGEFKDRENMAGTTVFVSPQLVRGTLIEAAKLFSALPEGLARAIFMMAVVTEVHPFTDGNGRLARLSMNSELSSLGQSRILVPILARDEYIDCLRKFSQQGDVDPLIRYMRHLQAWSAGFNYEDIDEVISQMTDCNAFEQSRIEYKLGDPGLGRDKSDLNTSHRLIRPGT